MRLLFPYLMSLFGILFLLTVALYHSTRDTFYEHDAVNKLMQPPSSVIE